MPSNNSQNVFKAKSILKPKSVKKIQKPDKNKENKGENIKEKEVPKQHSKQKSLIPRPSSKTSTERNSKQGEYQKYAVESKDREKSIPTKIPSRKSSVSKIPKPKMKEASKTEVLYQKAREAMEKSKKTNVKSTEKITEAAKPPIPKRINNQAVSDVVSKQTEIRKNLEHRSSFNGNSGKNANNSQSKEKHKCLNDAKLSRNKSINKRNDQIERRNTFDPKESKSIKPSQISRKEARARIGLADIPDEKINVLIKQSKDKLKTSEQRTQIQPVEDEINKHCFEYKSRQNNKSKIEKSHSIEMTSGNKGNHKKEIILKSRFDDVTFQPTMNIVNAQVPQCNYDEIKSSITDFEEYDHTYLQAYYNNATKNDSRDERRQRSRFTEKQKKTTDSSEDLQFSQQNTFFEKQVFIDSRKELVKLQQKEMIRKIKEVKEKTKQEELKKKQNLEALNSKIKKKSELYKRKKETETSDKIIDILANDEAFKGNNIKQHSISTNISSENAKFGYFGGQRQTSRTGTTKNSAGNSINQSVQSPLSRANFYNQEEQRKKYSIMDESSNSSSVIAMKGRKTFNPKIPKKSVKKVISIPSVKIDKRFEKEQKKLKRNFRVSDNSEMDPIAEIHDISETDTMSLVAKSNRKKAEEQHLNDNGDLNSRKVIVSKINKEVKTNISKLEEFKESKGKSKGKKLKKKKVSNSILKINNSTNADCKDNCINNENDYMRRNSYQSNGDVQYDYFKSANKSIKKEMDKSDIMRLSSKPEIEIQQNHYTVQSNVKNSIIDQAKKDDFENTELFSSKKFNDIMAKRKKFTRYIDVNEDEDEDDSMLDINSHRRSNNELHVSDVFDDDRDILEKCVNLKSINKDKSYLEKTPSIENYDKIKKVEITDSKKSKDLRMEDLTKSKKSIKNYEKQSNSSYIKNSNCQKSIDKIFTTSINLMDYNQMSPQKIDDSDCKNSKTQDDREDSLMKPPNWQLSSFKKPEINYDDVLGKNVIIDDYDEFHSDNEYPDDRYQDSDEAQHTDFKYKNSEDQHSCLINEDLGQAYNDEIHENVSVFENEDADDNIPFNLDDGSVHSNNEDDQESSQNNEGKETLKQMRMVFGSEQRIREQSEAAIHQLEHYESSVNDHHDLDHDEFCTPGLSKSNYEQKGSLSKSNIFMKTSFQEFSQKKFQEVMYEHNYSDFIDSVERSVRENGIEMKTKYNSKDGLNFDKSKTPKRNSNFISPRKCSRKEIELDRYVGNNMKYLSEKKKQRKSILDCNDSSLVKNITQNPLNRSLENFSSSYYQSKHPIDNTLSSKIKAPKINSEMNLKLNPPFKANSDLDGSIHIERTDQVIARNILYSNIAPQSKQSENFDSVKRSDIRGIEVLLSEKSHEFSSFEQENHTTSNRDSDEVKTLKYGTDERVENCNSIKSHKSQKDAMFDQLEKIMTNCFHDEEKEIKQENKNFETLNYYKTNEHNDEPQNVIVSPLSSQVSSPRNGKDEDNLDENDALNCTNGSKQNKSKHEEENSESIVTPRDLSNNEINLMAYQTPTSKNQSDTCNELKPKREISINELQSSVENTRREDAYTNQFYLNTNYEHVKSTRQLLSNSATQDEHIHIYVDQWDIENTEKKFDDLSSDAYLQSESIGIHTAKNSPLESNKKVIKETPTSEKYSVTEESAEKHLNEFNNELHTSDYLKQRFNKAKKNIESTCKDNLKNCVNSPDNVDFNLSNSNINQEINIECIQPKYLDQAKNYVECINNSSPVPRDQRSPSSFDESKCIILSNKKCKSIDSDNVVSIIDDSDKIYQTRDNQKKADYLTEEILSMMFFSDIHENPMFPYRNNSILTETKDKYPFNKPLGISTDEEGVSQFLNQLISHIEEYYINDIIYNLEKPVVMDPLIELSMIQLYEENNKSLQFEDIIPHEIFFSLEQIRKNINILKNEENRLISNEEMESKIHNTFIHDKMIFDCFNKAINILYIKREELPPWANGKRRLSQKSFNKEKAIKLLKKAKKLVLEWNKVEAGTRKVPPPPLSTQSQNFDDIFAPPPAAPSDSERNQQIREEKLCTLLSTDINDEDKQWMKYEECLTQVKLDLADMILEDLAGEFAFLMISKRLF